MSVNPSNSRPQPGWYNDPSGAPQMRWWDGNTWSQHVGGHGVQGRGEIPPGKPVYNPFIWIAVLAPLMGIIGLLVWNPHITFQSVDGIQTINPSSLFNVGYVVLILLGWVGYAAVVVMSYLDSRHLRSDGLTRPFPWPWAFLTLVYIIGRIVIVRQTAQKRGMAVLWVLIGVYVVMFIAGGIFEAHLLGPMMNQLSNLPSS